MKRDSRAEEEAALEGGAVLTAEEIADRLLRARAIAPLKRCFERRHVFHTGAVRRAIGIADASCQTHAWDEGAR